MSNVTDINCECDDAQPEGEINTTSSQRIHMRSPNMHTLPSSKELSNVIDQVDEVVQIVHVNIDKFLECNQHKSDLDRRVDDLQGPLIYRPSEPKTKRTCCPESRKLWLVIVVLLLVIIVILTRR